MTVVPVDPLTQSLRLTGHSPVRERIPILDVARGLAVLLMITDHLLALFPASWAAFALRETVTRLSLPMFCGVSGILWSIRGRPGRSRFHQLAIAACAAEIAAIKLGGDSPDVLVWMLLAQALAPVIMRLPLGVIVIGVVQMATWHVPGHTYQPGEVLALCAVGVLLGGCSFPVVVISGAAARCIERAGRWPLSFYLGHFAAIYWLGWWIHAQHVRN